MSPPPPSSAPAPGRRGPRQAPPGLREQLGATFDAVKALVAAHIELARTEASAIAHEVGRVAALGAAAFGLVVIALFLLVIGGALWLGEWLLGSMGWGVLHGFLACLSVALALVLMAIGVSTRRIGRALLLAVVAGVVIGVVLGLDLANGLYTQIGESATLALDPGYRPLVVGMLVGGLIGLVVGIVVAVRMTGGAGGRIAAVIGFAIVGLAAGAFTAITFGPQVGAAIGITAGYLIWMGLMGTDVAMTGIDIDALKQRFYPAQTIETSKETLEWLQKRMPPGIGS
jgi:hypothetical protein